MRQEQKIKFAGRHVGLPTLLVPSGSAGRGDALTAANFSTDRSSIEARIWAQDRMKNSKIHMQMDRNQQVILLFFASGGLDQFVLIYLSDVLARSVELCSLINGAVTRHDLPRTSFFSHTSRGAL